jgi:hypothetical protein
MRGFANYITMITSFKERDEPAQLLWEDTRKGPALAMSCQTLSPLLMFMCATLLHAADAGSLAGEEEAGRLSRPLKRRTREDTQVEHAED